MNILDGLNPEQLTAAQHADGPLLVVAGAGTGKTQVITRRIAYLIAEGKAKPSQVLALTFTEKAAREMEERLYELIGWQSFQVPVMTFHAFGTDLLSRYSTHVGRSIRGGLLNDTQKTLLLKQHIHSVTLKYYGLQSDLFEFLEGIVGFIGELQNAAVGPDEYESYVATLQANPGEIHPKEIDEQVDLATLYRLYEEIKVKTGTFDYNDQLQLPLRILNERPNLAERLSHEYKYVLVDEYQDTNRVQDELLRKFIGAEGNLFAVGDDDQAIYGFRGADISNILGFSKHFKLEQPAVLVRNYRSGQAILDASYRLIRHNDPERLESKLGINKRLIAQHNNSTAEFIPYGTAADEVEGVLTDIEARLGAGEPAGSIAVLAATHAPLKAMAKVMRSRNIPFALATSVNIFEQPELIGLWYLLKWLNWQIDDEAIGHVLMGPFIKWTTDQCRVALDSARQELITVEESLRRSEDSEAVQLVRQLDEWRSWAQDLPVSQLVFRLIFDTGRAEIWRDKAQTSPRMIRVFEDIQRLLDQMQDFESVALNPALVEYLQTFPKPPALEVSEPTGDAEGVQLLTVHASKGLEFETVYLVACTQRSWSGARTPSREIPEQLRRDDQLPPEHEYRRLMYVAATRARRSLIVSSPTRGAAGGRQAPSPFIGELFGADSMKKIVTEDGSGQLDNALQKIQRFYPLSHLVTNKSLPFETSDGWIELSVTQLGGYEYCPFEFYMQNVLQIKQPMGPQLSFGNALHHVFESYYKSVLSGAVRSEPELHVLLDELWSERGYSSKDLAEADRQLAHSTLDSFLVREKNVNRQILGSEVAIRFDVPEAKLRLRGKIDALFTTSEGTEIRDFKTGRNKTNVEKLQVLAKSNFQLRTYALAYEALNGQPPAQVTLDYVVTGVEGVSTLSSTILKNHREKLITLTSKIRAGEFAPDPSPMHNCAAIKYYGTGERDELVQESLRKDEAMQ